MTRAGTLEGESTAVRHRVRRALLTLALTERQRSEARGLRLTLRELEQTRGSLEESRRLLRRELVHEQPDSKRLCELLAQERHLQDLERLSSARLEHALAALLTPQQVLRVQALRPVVLSRLLTKLVV